MDFRKISFSSAIFVLLTLAGVAQEKLTHITDFGNNPGNLRMYAYMSDSAKNKPLVVVLHGCTETANSCASLTDWNKWARQYGFAVLYPEQQISNNPNRCFNWFDKGDQQRDKGEPASIAAMIKKMHELYLVDTSHIFISGLSAGAAMATIMMSVYPENFLAGAVFAGGPYGAADNFLQASAAMNGKINHSPETWGNLVRAQQKNPVKIYPRLAIFQGMADQIVSPRNADALTSQWRNLQTDSLTAWTSDSLFGNPYIKRTVFLDSIETYRIVRYDIRDLGHAIPIDPGDCPCQSGKTGTWAKDRNFNAIFATLDFFGLIPPVTKNAIYTNESAIVYRHVFYIDYTQGSNYSWISSSQGYRSGSTTPTFILMSKKSFTVEMQEIDSNGCALPVQRIRIGRAY
ncbi:MAG: extracellular catalytic domain type 1 short-chain-length polyhydroxyalkanoate depolymerase [Bacteroidia bacterium]